MGRRSGGPNGLPVHVLVLAEMVPWGLVLLGYALSAPDKDGAQLLFAAASVALLCGAWKGRRSARIAFLLWSSLLGLLGLVFLAGLLRAWLLWRYVLPAHYYLGGLGWLCQGFFPLLLRFSKPRARR